MKSPLNVFLNTRFGENSVAFYANLTFRRWLESLLLIAVTTALYPAIEPPLIRLSNSLATYSADYPHLTLLVGLFTLSIVLTIVLARLGCIHPDYTIRTMLKYPPVWLIALFATGALLLYSAYFHKIDIGTFCHQNNQPVLEAIAAMTGGSLLVLLSMKLGSCVNSDKIPNWREYRSANGQSKHLNESERSFLSWVINESPIQNPNADFYSHNIQAVRIASLIDQDSPASIGIVGPFGSGKSCLIEFIEHNLSNKDPNRFILCKIDAWGRANGSIAEGQGS